MTDFSTFFPFTGGAAAAEADWGLFAQLWATDGVVRGADSELAVTPTGTPDLNVHVGSGEAWIQGYFGRRGTTADFAVTPHATLPRKDIVVARLNLTTHKMELLYRTGTADAAPTPPTPTHTAGTTWDIVLAEISLSAAATSIPAGSITDKRPWASGGRVVRTADVPSASPLVIPNVDQVANGGLAVVPITGTTNFNTINGPLSGYPVIILEFSAGLIITSGAGNIFLERNIATQGGCHLTLEWEGGVWREIARSGDLIAANLVHAGPASGASVSPTYRALVQDDFPAALWSTASVTVGSQGGAMTYTPNYGRLLKMGKFFRYQYKGTVNSNLGSAGNIISVTLPFSYTSATIVPMGEFRWDRISGPIHTGIVIASDGATTVTFMVPTLGLLGASPNFLAVSTDILYFSISGELA